MEPLAKKKFLQDNQQRYSKMDTKKKKEKVSKQKEKQQSLNSIKKAVLLTKRRNNYKSINLSKKSDLLRHLQDNYHSMDSSKKNDLLSQRRKHYQEMDTLKKKKMVDKLRIKRKKGNENRIPTVESCITQFKEKIREGPFFVCNVCKAIVDSMEELKLHSKEGHTPIHDTSKQICRFYRQGTCKWRFSYQRSLSN